MTTSSNLNYSGQAGLAVVSSVVMNAAVHPLCTIKNKMMASKPNESLFNGLPFRDASIQVAREVLTTQGRKSIGKDACIRAVYIGLSVAIINVINNRLPAYFPNSMRE